VQDLELGMAAGGSHLDNSPEVNGAWGMHSAPLPLTNGALAKPTNGTLPGADGPLPGAEGRLAAKAGSGCGGGGQGGIRGYTTALPFEPLAFTFKDVSYSVPMPKVSWGQQEQMGKRRDRLCMPGAWLVGLVLAVCGLPFSLCAVGALLQHACI
jgi:hypothetical protein